MSKCKKCGFPTKVCVCARWKREDTEETPTDKSPREHLHISLNARAAGKNYDLFMRLMAEAVKNAPSNITFTCPDIIKLQQELEIQDDANDILTRQLEEKQQELEAAQEKNHTLKVAIDLTAKQLADAQAQIKDYESALESISKNSCCDKCQEAKLVAKSPLEKWNGK